MTVFHRETRGLVTIVPAAVASIGETIIVHGVPTMVTDVTNYPAESHHGSPLPLCLVARCVTAGTAERWFGHLPGRRYRGAEILGLEPEGVSFG
jgi:hypothetical protein